MLVPPELAGPRAPISRQRERVFQVVRNRIAEALGVGEDVVVLQASLVEDLGAESLDLLDIVFRIETAFSVTIPQTDFRQLAEDEVSANGDRFEVEGVLTCPGLRGLRNVLPEVPEDRFRTGLTIRDIPTLYTVETILDLAFREIEREERTS